MLSTYTVKTLQRETATAIKKAEKGELVTITRHETPVAVIVGQERMAAIVETMEILANPSAMKAIKNGKKPGAKSYSLDDLK